AEDGAAHGRLSASISEGDEAFPLLRLVIGVVAVPDLRFSGGRQVHHPGVPGGVVHRRGAIEEFTWFFVLEVPFVVGAAVVRSVAIGPSPGNGLGCDLPLDVPHRATLVVRIGRVGPVVSPGDSVCYRVVGKPERVPKAEDIDLLAYLVLRI